MQLVEVGSLPAMISGGILTFSIPGGAQNLQAEGNFIREESNGDFVWWANLINTSGYIGVAKNNTGQFAYIQYDTNYYQVHPLSNRYNALVKLNRHIPTAQMCPDNGMTPPPTEPDHCNAYNDCPAMVSILVLVTPEALNALGFTPGSMDAALYIPFGLHSINFALANSAIYNKSCRFVVEAYDFDYTIGTNDITYDLTQLENDAQAIARRNATRCDLLVLLTNDRYDNALGVWYDFDRFGIVTIEHLFGLRNVFAHEIGHAFRTNHTREEEGYFGHDLCAFGYYFSDSDGVGHKTVMATLKTPDIANGITHILNYSNPEVDFNGSPTGTEFDANAYKISERMCNVQDYFVDEELEIGIDGPLECCNNTVYFSAELINQPPLGQPGCPPYTYSWWKSSNGFFNPLSGSNNPLPQYLGNTPNISVTSNTTFWLKLEVCGVGACANRVIKVVDCDGAPPLPMTQTTSVSNHVLSEFNITVRPSGIWLQVEEFGAGKTEFTIVNTLGQVFAHQIPAPELDSAIEIPMPGNAPSGLYYCIFQNGVGSQTKSFSFIR